MEKEFEIIKNMPDGSFDFDDSYKWGKELLDNLLKIGLDGWDSFENDTFKIVPYDWDGLCDCTCYVAKETDKMYEDGCNDNEVESFEDMHMHSIGCSSRSTNFYHAPTGVSVSWRKHVDSFRRINKSITYKQWQDIVQDCVKSVLKSEYNEPIDKIYLNCVVMFEHHNITKEEFEEKFETFIKNNGWEMETLY